MTAPNLCFLLCCCWFNRKIDTAQMAIQDLLSRSWGGILSSNLFFKNIRISDLNCHGTSRRSQRRTIMIQRPECKYFSSFHPVGSCLDPCECRKKSCRLGGTAPQRHPPRWQVKKKQIYRLFDIADMNNLTKQSKDSLQKSTWGERKKSKQTLETAHWLPTKRIQHDAPLQIKILPVSNLSYFTYF